MGLWDKLFGEFVDIIEWTDSSVDTMVYRFQRYGNEIKFGAKLTVRESQVFNTRQFVDLKWGTKNPIMMRDKEFSMVRLRTFGTYNIRIDDPAKFIREIVGTDGHFTVDEISSQLRNLIITRYTDILGSSDIPVLDLAGNQGQLGELLTQRIAPEFKDYGLELTQILVENISLPPAVEEALDKRTSMGMIGDLNKYIQFGAAESMQLGNNGGGAGSAIEMGLGFAMANKMTHEMAAPQQSPQGGSPSVVTMTAAASTPPPLPDTNWHVAIDRQSMGPYDLSTLQELAINRQISPATLAWIDGMATWEAIENIDSLNGLFAEDDSIPPRLPNS